MAALRTTHPRALQRPCLPPATPPTPPRVTLPHASPPLSTQAMATRVQGLWRQYARADQLAKDWDELMLRVSCAAPRVPHGNAGAPAGPVPAPGHGLPRAAAARVCTCMVIAGAGCMYHPGIASQLGCLAICAATPPHPAVSCTLPAFISCACLCAVVQRLGASIKDDLRQQYEGLGGSGLELGGEPAAAESLPPPGAKQQPLDHAEQVRGLWLHNRWQPGWLVGASSTPAAGLAAWACGVRSPLRPPPGSLLKFACRLCRLSALLQERQAEEAEEEGEPDESSDSQAADEQEEEQQQAQQDGGDDRRR